MKNKIKALFSSIRFYQLLLIAIIQILVAVNVINSEQGIAVSNILSVFLGAVASIGTIDKAARPVRAAVN